LAIVGYEWIIVLAIIVVLFVWGPQKLPEFARSIGLARKEIETAYKEATSPTMTSQPPEMDPLLETAKKLGISTEGKTKAQISDEIVGTTMRPRPAETDPLLETAKTLGIAIEGKTKAQISDEIVAKAKTSGT
jgi:sec-independent protein translocase protein TatA